MPCTHEGFLNRSIYSSPQSSLILYPAFFFSTLASKEGRYIFFEIFLSLCILHWYMPAHQGSSKSVAWHLSPVPRIRCGTKEVFYRLKKKKEV